MTRTHALCWLALLLVGTAVHAKAPIHRAPHAWKRQDKKDCFIVRLKDDIAPEVQQRLFQEMEGDGDGCRSFGGVFRGFSKCGARMSQLQKLAEDSLVMEIEEDQVATIDAIQTVSSDRWNLDRIDEQTRALDQKFHYERTGQGVSVYIVDTGVQGNHQDFGGRVEAGKDLVGSNSANVDCNGHGTHVAGIAAGAASGVAKSAAIIPVRVVNCGGTAAYADVIAGLDWIRLQSQRRPGVINLSFGGPLSAAMNTAVANLIAAGYHVVAAAGNSAGGSCGKSPASAPDAITVGSTTRTDALSSFSNFGSCVDLLAPGSDIYSADSQNRLGFKFMSGTSMSSPIVAGVVATYLEANPSITPVAMASLLKNAATVLPGLAADTPNLLLYSAGDVPGTNPNPVPGSSSSASSSSPEADPEPVPDPESPSSSEQDPEPEPEPVLPPCPGNSKGNNNKKCIPAPPACPGKSQKNKKNCVSEAGSGSASGSDDANPPNRRAGTPDLAPSVAVTPAGHLVWLGAPLLGLVGLAALLSLRRQNFAAAVPDPLPAAGLDLPGEPLSV